MNPENFIEPKALFAGGLEDLPVWIKLLITAGVFVLIFAASAGAGFNPDQRDNRED